MIRQRVRRDYLVQIITLIALVCIIFGGLTKYSYSSIVIINETTEVTKEELPAIIEIAYDAKSIEALIRKTFYEDPNTAVAIALNEGGLVTEKQSNYYRNGVRERSYCAFQINAPSWETKANKLGYGDYKTNVESCVSMARYIYDNHGWQPWSAYTNGSYLRDM